MQTPPAYDEATFFERSFKIGIDARFYRRETGGLGRYTRELLAALSKLDTVNDYSIFLTKRDLAQYDIAASNFKPVLVDIPHFSVAEQIRLAVFLRQQRFDLVHFLNPNHPLLYQGPFLTTVHDLTVIKLPHTEKASLAATTKARVFRKVVRRAVLAGRRTIAVSKFTADDVAKTLRVPRSRIDVVYEGWPHSPGQAVAEPDDLRQVLKRSEPYFLFVSQWRVHKGILTLLDAFAKFKSNRSRPHLLVLGGRPDSAARSVSEALERHPFRSDIVTPGFVSDEVLAAMYAYATAFVMPSEYEGFGLPVLEAFAHRTPAILTDSSSLPEVGGEAAIYFPARDSDALCRAMERMVDEPDLAATLRREIPNQLAKFSWEDCARNTLQIYREILRPSASIGS